MKKQVSKKANKNQIIRGLSISTAVIGFVAMVLLMVLATNTMAARTKPLIPDKMLPYVVYGTSALTLVVVGLTMAIGILVLISKEDIKQYSNSNLGMSLIVVAAATLLCCIVVVLMVYVGKIPMTTVTWVFVYIPIALGVLASALISSLVAGALCKKQAKK